MAAGTIGVVAADAAGDLEARALVQRASSERRSFITNGGKPWLARCYADVGERVRYFAETIRRYVDT
jgi:hypothetical protein